MNTLRQAWAALLLLIGKLPETEELELKVEFEPNQKDGKPTDSVQSYVFEDERFTQRKLNGEKAIGWAGIKKFCAESWGLNARRGHIISVLFGISAPGVDLMLFGRFSDFGILAVFSSFVIFPPLLLAAKGQDIESEGSEFYWLTFGPSRVFGNFFGGFIWSIAYVLLIRYWHEFSAYIIWMREFLGVVGEDGKANAEVHNSMLTFGNLQALLVAVRVCWSYFMVGQLSRNFLNAIVASFGSFPSHVRRVIGLMTEVGFQHRTRQMQERLLSYKSRYAQATLLGILDSVVEKMLEDPEVALGDIYDVIDLFQRTDRELGNWKNETDSPVTVVALPTERSAT